MRRSIEASAVASLLLFAALAVPGAGVTFTILYTDPASDVVRLWSSNMTPVLDVNGEPFMSPFPDAINMVRLRSAESGGGMNVTLAVEVQGSIANLDNTTYEARLYTRADNASHFMVSYVNGTTTLGSNDTSFSAIDITGNSTVGSTGPNPTLENTLEIRVAKSLLGNITAWNIDATTTQLGATYSYRDFGWEIPGNPGSAPTTVYGIVTEAGSRTGLAGVNVSTDVGKHWTMTNATGAYSLSISPGTYNVTFTLGGYETRTLQVTLATGDTMSLDVELSRVGFFEQTGNWLWVLLVGLSLATLLVAAMLFWRRRRSNHLVQRSSARERRTDRESHDGRRETDETIQDSAGHPEPEAADPEQLVEPR